MTRNRPRIGLYTLAIIASVISFLPIIWLILTSIKTTAGIYAWPPQYLPAPVTFQNYIDIFTKSPELLLYVLNSLIVGLGTTIVSLSLGGMAGYALSRLGMRRAGVLMVFILAVSMFPPVSLLPSLFQTFLNLGLLNTYTGLIIAHTGLFLPFSVWMLASYFATLPKEIEEAARMDGMGFFRIFWSIVIPLSWPGFVATGLIVFIHSWNEFPLALVLMTQNAMRTAPVGISLYPGEYAFPWETISTATVIAIVPILVITAIFQKQIVGGLTAGTGK
ncbi:carbohydrate ABC transporter membrane protein 2 (CUT1 family) [Aliiruegeria haliotis]|uniref:Carbohydrate ABC transporter membrane protein 2 (CUT1 family) n=1 Tax=Aliiruegeria haliotis TaxID=1280846 RepID=A0A2T0RFF8_9RHOB|nr:carbohydrate ABC transporter permease [Aliiruegeria haliotis]PRY19944.1 carbohydrate ABC transporter membrane protein 2 (CUT1 family) [Aliiruegeria haliotis]